MFTCIRSMYSLVFKQKNPGSLMDFVMKKKHKSAERIDCDVRDHQTERSQLVLKAALLRRWFLIR